MSEGSPSSTVPIVLKDVRVSSFQLLMCFAYTGFVELKSAQLEVNGKLYAYHALIFCI